LQIGSRARQSHPVTDDRIHAVLTAPQLTRFRELCQLGDADLSTDFSGWNRHVILSPDSAFLFPRHQSSVPGLIREQTALQSIQDQGTPAPRLLGSWQDDCVSPYPFLRISRISGDPLGQHSLGIPGEGLGYCASLDQVLTVMRELGRAIATWHRIDTNHLDTELRDPTPDLNEFAVKLDHSAITETASRAAAAAGLTSDHAREWVQILHPLAAMPAVLVHGDLHQSQILIDETPKITGVIDWEHACAGHPLKDFDFGEWGFGIFAWEEHFATLRQELWNSYRDARGDPNLPDWRTIHLYFSITELAYFSQESGNDPWTAQRQQRSRALVAELT
jgi:aminoglycoside phosphotransferase (APT) family kinase protein